ncbi:hypothetical protein [Roseomonas alba]|nr:hypothetical protein [Neoroseomonas alba]
MRAPAPSSGFWKGVAVAVPLSVPLWAGIIYAARYLWQALS